MGMVGVRGGLGVVSCTPTTIARLIVPSVALTRGVDGPPHGTQS
ncbi:MAG: hypothetical protein AAGA56_07350 [Myxococcota bacterium]